MLKAKKLAKKGTILFDDNYHILTGSKDPELFYNWLAFLKKRFLKSFAKDYVNYDALEKTIFCKLRP